MKVKNTVIIRREDGFFHLQDRKIKAYYPGNGYVVMVLMEPSPIDKDFGTYIWVPSVVEIEKILKSFDNSDESTYERRGGIGWDKGPRPYQPTQKLADFI